MLGGSVHVAAAKLRECGMIFPEAGDGCYPGYWTAGHRVGTSWEWAWRVWSARTSSYEESAMTYTGWHPGQPDNHGEDLGDICAMLYLDWDFRWFDYPCSNRHCPVCEIDLN